MQPFLLMQMNRAPEGVSSPRAIHNNGILALPEVLILAGLMGLALFSIAQKWQRTMVRRRRIRHLEALWQLDRTDQLL